MICLFLFFSANSLVSIKNKREAVRFSSSSYMIMDNFFVSFYEDNGNIYLDSWHFLWLQWVTLNS